MHSFSISIIIKGWTIFLKELRNRDTTRSLDNQENEIIVQIPVTLVDNPKFFVGDIQSMIIEVSVDENSTAKASHNIRFVQSSSIMETEDVPDVAKVSIS